MEAAREQYDSPHSQDSDNDSDDDVGAQSSSGKVHFPGINCFAIVVVVVVGFGLKIEIRSSI